MTTKTKLVTITKDQLIDMIQETGIDGMYNVVQNPTIFAQWSDPQRQTLSHTENIDETFTIQVEVYEDDECK